jgi:hypothetical protein
MHSEINGDAGVPAEASQVDFYWASNTTILYPIQS